MPMKDVDADTLKTWVDRGEALIIDVREPEEYKIASIPGSKLIPLSTLSMHTLPDLTGKKIVMHCQFGKRGSKACEKLLLEAPELEIYNLAGGISTWIAAGFDVKTQ